MNDEQQRESASVIEPAGESVNGPFAPANGERHTVRAVERALDILLCFAATDGELGLTEIANRVNLHKSTVYRLLGSLEARGFVRRTRAADRYRLGYAALELASHVSRSDDLPIVALPDMIALRDELGETISLYVRAGNERVRVQSVEGTQAIRRVARVGQRFPLYVGASGKVLLAYSNESIKAEVLRRDTLPADVDSADLARQLDSVRSRGYAVSIEEREAGAAAVAAPIFDRAENIAASLAVSGPAERFTPETVKRFAQAVQQIAARIGKSFL